MAEQTAFNYKHITASAVVAGTGAAGSQGTDNVGKQSRLHAVNINQGAAAATINIYDYNSTTSPPAANLMAAFVAPAGGYTVPTGQLFDVMCLTGITVIVTGTVDLTITYI